MANRNQPKGPIEPGASKPDRTNDYHHRSYPARWWVLPVVIGGLFLIMIIGMFSALWWGGSGHFGYRDYKYGPMRMMGDERGFSSGGFRYIDSQNQAKGVVTAVSGSSFTLAGHGSTTSVQTSSSTQYQGGNQVKVNDTVIVLGTTSNGALFADEVIINP